MVILLLKISDFAGFLELIIGEVLATGISSQLTGGRAIHRVESTFSFLRS